MKTAASLGEFWEVTKVSREGILRAGDKTGFMFELAGFDGSFLSLENLNSLHHEWRSALRFSPGDEIQFLFRKRVEFKNWIESQLQQAFLAGNSYGRRILLDRLADQVMKMGRDEPALLTQTILACFWTRENLSDEDCPAKRGLVRAQLQSFGFRCESLTSEAIESEISASAQDLASAESPSPEWPALKLEAGSILVNGDRFRALELTRLPESQTEMGMIRHLANLPLPLDICVRLTARDLRPIVTRLERKRNLLNARLESHSSGAASAESQLQQVDSVLRSFADKSESVFDLQMIIGLRMPEALASVQRRALANLIRAGAKMDFCEFEEVTLGTFDAYLECIPSFCGRNLRKHTVLGSNAIHFLPFQRPSRGDRRAVATFQTTLGSLYAIDPVDKRLANYNWLVSGTSGAGKSFFVNSLLAQSASLEPNIFIVDIGGSYNKLTRFLGGRIMSFEPGKGFDLSPFFLPKCEDPSEERLRRQHIFQVFLEMTRVDGSLPALEVRHLLLETLSELFEAETLPEHPISDVYARLGSESGESRRLRLLLQPWTKGGFNGQFLDNAKIPAWDDRLLTFDLKGLTEFEDLSRVVQLIICSSLWARVRRAGGERFSWIVLDEVAFSLLKTQAAFVDELVSTLRKWFAGAIVVVQDLEKITSNYAGSGILQNTQSKAILQQRGDPRNFAEALALNEIDQWAIAGLGREKGVYSDIFLMRDSDRTVVRHVPSKLEYWLSTTAPEDNLEMRRSLENERGQDFQRNVMDFVARRNQ